LNAATNPSAGEEIRLDIFATSDLHGCVLQFDYVRMTPIQSAAFVQLGQTIKEACARSVNALLFDNGDLIQGTAFADTLIKNRASGLNMHSFLGLCSYDAATLGNHDLDYGPEVVDDLLATASCPYVCANIETAPFEKPPRFILLERTVYSSTGQEHELKIGVTGCMPKQTQDWASLSMGPDFIVSDPVDAVRTAVAEMRKAGADLCIVLAHSGYTPEPEAEEPANIARSISELTCVDAVIAGHIHSIFATNSVKDAAAATVMPGSYGTHLGHIALQLFPENGRWTTKSGLADAVECVPFQTGDTDIYNTAQNNHRATLARMTACVGQTRYPISTFFGQVAPTNASQFIHDAQLWQLAQTLEGTQFEDLPRLSATSLPRLGGREGVENYSFIPSGPINLNNIHDLYPYENQFCALILSGAEIRTWLEFSASNFNQITIGQTDQMLLNPKCPGYDFDTIGDLTYKFDLSQPAAFDSTGAPLLPFEQRRRLRQAKWNGELLRDDQMFALATNGHRRARFADATCIEGHINTRRVLVNYLSQRQVIDPSASPNWGFTQLPNTSAVFETSPKALKYGKLPNHVSHVGPAKNGFTRFRLTF